MFTCCIIYICLYLWTLYQYVGSFFTSNIESSQFSWLGPRGCRQSPWFFNKHFLTSSVQPKIRVTCQFQVGFGKALQYIGGKDWRVLWGFPLNEPSSRFRIWLQKSLTRAGLTIIQPAIGASRIWAVIHIRANWIKSMVMSPEWCFLMGEMMEESYREITLKLDLDWQSFQDRVSLVALLHLNPNVMLVSTFLVLALWGNHNSNRISILNL